MKFIVDAQLPKVLSDFIKSKVIDSIHTLELPDKNKTQDGYITRLASDEQFIIITKDASKETKRRSNEKNICTLSFITSP